jgi:hypothetical protein
MNLISAVSTYIPSASTLFASVYTAEWALHIVENIRPNWNLNLYHKKSISKCPVEFQNKIAHIDQIKYKICQQIGLPADRIQICLQANTIIEAHGTSQKAILGIGLELLSQYQINKKIPQKEKISFQEFLKKLKLIPLLEVENEVENMPSAQKRLALQDFLNQLPDNGDQIKEFIEALPAQAQKGLFYLTKEYFLDLEEDELGFLIAHEIAGHIKNNDSTTFGASTTLLNIGAYMGAEYINSLWSFPGSSYAWHGIFYGLSHLCVLSVTGKRHEKRADAQACAFGHAEGGTRYFKRLLATNLLKKQHGALHSFDSKGDYRFDYRHDPIYKRLACCLKDCSEDQSPILEAPYLKLTARNTT